MGLEALHPALLYAASAALGACVGSFLNVVAYRLPRDESIVHPPSRCPACDAPIPAWANVPVVSWLALRGHCRSCNARIPLRYLGVEASTALLFALLLWRALAVEGVLGARLLVEWALAAALVAVALIDADEQIIPNEITLPGIPLGLLFAWWIPGPGLRDALLGAAVLGGALWALSAGYERLRGHIGLGMGDVKLMAMLGAFLGLQAGVEILVVGSLLGLVWALVVIGFRGGGRFTRIPFGPALASAALFQLFAPGAVSRGLAVLGL